MARALHQVRVGRLEHQVKVVAHQAIRLHLPARVLTDPPMAPWKERAGAREDACPRVSRGWAIACRQGSSGGTPG